MPRWDHDDLLGRHRLAHPITRHNPHRVESAQWVDPLRDLGRARNVSAIVGYLFKPFNWAPHGDDNKTAELHAHTRAAEQPVGSSRV